MSDRRRRAGPSPRSPLTRERVVAAALRIVDRDGFDKLTMRALGTELGVDPMAVYHHLPNKAAVLDGIAEAVMSEVPLEIAPGVPWQEQLADLARGYRATLRAHPHALPILASRPDSSRPALRAIDASVGILLRAGLSPADALMAMHTTSCLVLGYALDELGFPLLAPTGDPTGPAATRPPDPPDEPDYPSLAIIAAVPSSVSVDDSFEMGLAAMIDGFAARIPTTPGRP